LWTIPNLLTLLRLALSFALFVVIGWEAWLAALGIFGLAAVTDWLDGWIARAYGQGSALGRNLDPLVDKILICGAFICLIPVAHAGMPVWVVLVVVIRELVVTGGRSLLESQRIEFGADWFGKLKMVLQCVAMVVILIYLDVLQNGRVETMPWGATVARDAVVYAMALATALSGLHYAWKFLGHARTLPELG
jgi:CDP-diacylglycerol--glycerol-3-phosphate 3-phosphatidyltransferase